nr:MAG TPA: hypothetical protein [Caudoviricetes sp.]
MCLIAFQQYYARKILFCRETVLKRKKGAIGCLCLN